jgi:hypothetical protein
MFPLGGNIASIDISFQHSRPRSYSAAENTLAKGAYNARDAIRGLR